MRLTPEQVAIIREAAAEVFGSDARVWLFGSRVDDAKRGGDIDLLIECDQTITNPAFSAARMAAQVQRGLHGRKVDVLLSAPDLLRLPIHEIARSQGVSL